LPTKWHKQLLVLVKILYAMACTWYIFTLLIWSILHETITCNNLSKKTLQRIKSDVISDICSRADGISLSLSEINGRWNLYVFHSGHGPAAKSCQWKRNFRDQIPAPASCCNTAAITYHQASNTLHRSIYFSIIFLIKSYFMLFNWIYYIIDLDIDDQN